MSALKFIEDLWSPPDPANRPPQRQFVAGTLGGVHGAIGDFTRLYVYEGQQRKGVKRKLAERHQARASARTTFLSEFLHLSSMLTEGLIIGIVGKGGQVTSLYHGKRGSRAESLTREAGRALFAKGTMAIAVDESGRRAVTAIGWNVEKQFTFEDPSPLPPLAPPVAPPVAPPSLREPMPAAPWLERSQASKEDALLVAQARLAILNGRWGSRQRPS
jgi:hypothetical protein